ncbi:MAG: hypothetical protein JW982_03065 [Spirochaetes bacterium]|nr:hypothetical protein [Spirochaetota bacterium]
MNIVIKLNYTEKMKVLSYCSNLREKGHWGSSDFVTPEEQELFSIVEKSEGSVELSHYMLQLLLNWIDESTSSGKYLIDEDISIINNLYAGINGYHLEIQKNYNSAVNDTLKLIKKLDSFTESSEHVFEKFTDQKLLSQSEELFNRIDILNSKFRNLENDFMNLRNEFEAGRKKHSIFSMIRNKTNKNESIKNTASAEKAEEKKSEKKEMSADDLVRNAEISAKKLKKHF